MRYTCWSLPFLGLIGGCTDVVWDPDDPDTGTPEDRACPLIVHDVVATAQELGESVPVLATVSDDADGDALRDVDESGVFVVRVFYKQETSTRWESSDLSPVDASGAFGGSIPGSAVAGGGMDYYLYAVDRRDNACTLPEEGETDPWHFRIHADG